MNPGIQVQVRLDDCDTFGHVKNSAYLNYLHYALAKIMIQLGFAQDWMNDSELVWSLNTATIEYQKAAVFGDLLHVELWLEESNLSTPIFGCEIIKSDFSGQHNVESIVRMLTGWQRVSRVHGELKPLPRHTLSLFPRARGELPRQFELPGDDGQSRQYFWNHTIMQSEIGPGGRILPQAIYNWLEDAVFEASAEAGWPLKKQRAAGAFNFQQRHDTEIFSVPDAGDTIQVASRLLNVKESRATWLQEILLMPEQGLCILDYSTEIFVDAYGHPRTPPPMMLSDIQFKGKPHEISLWRSQFL